MPLKSIYLGTALALCSVSVMAGELDAFVASTDGASSCWMRAYDARHLAAHPNQQVTAMDLAVTYTAETDINPAQFVFWLDVDMRDGSHGQASGPCMADGDQMWCGVECDGGGIYVANRSGGKVLVDLERRGSISMTSSCGEENFEDGFALQSGLDDRQFLLTALLPQFCEPTTF